MDMDISKHPCRRMKGTYYETNLSAKPNQKSQNPWIPKKDVH